MPAPAPGVTEDLVRILYRVHLGREPESREAIGGHLARHATPEGLVRAIALSEEAREYRRWQAAVAGIAAWQAQAPWLAGARRILLFGAYGNGNLGDAAQAQAVAALLRQALPGPLDIRATSWIDARPDYPFDPARRAPAGTIAELPALAQHDLLLIGGGGLFGSEHRPLLDPGWGAALRALGLPYGLFGVGAASTLPQEPHLAPTWQALRDGAGFLSGRDRASLAAMPGAAWLADPVLVAGLRAGRGRPRPPGPGARPLCIVKRPGNAEEAAFLDQVAALGSACDVAAIEPWQEQDLAARFPGLRFVEDWAALEALCAAASVVVSARYHGCIAAMLAGVPCLGAHVGKTWVLFDTLGRAECYLPPGTDLAARLAVPPAPLGPGDFAPMLAAAAEALRQLAVLVEGLPRRAGA